MRSKAQVARRRIFLISSILALGLVVIGSRQSDLLSSFTQKVFAPILPPFARAGEFVADLASTVTSISSLAKENKELEDRLAGAEAKVAELEIVKEENKQLRKELESPYRSDFSLVPATVISRDVNSSNQTILIGIGKKDKVKVGQVVVYHGILVGKIKEVFESSSRVTLLINLESLIPAVTTRTRADGLLRGQLGAGSLLLTQIDQAADIKSGDMVLASLEGEFVPSGLLIGEVERVLEESNEPLKSAEVRPAIDVARLGTVFVVVGTR